MTVPHTATTVLELNDRIEAAADALHHEHGLHHEAKAEWLVITANALETITRVDALASTRRARHFSASVHPLAGGLATIYVQNGEARVRAFGNTPTHALQVLKAAREAVPSDENPDRNVVPVTFWTYGPHGARSIRRDLDAPAWTDIAGNYPAGTGEAVGRLMAPDFRAGVGGQLLLWNGDPGTGKTTALRALAREWRDWLDVHYVVDPDQFFGAHADYMMDVLMGFDDEPDQPRWRLLVLEDCGEMLQPDARREVGQALSRFLNACDGLIGRGLRFLALVTTNEPVDKLHEAVSRPGRCAARVEFERFDTAEARAWLHERTERDTEAVPSRPTLADLFAIVDGLRQPEERQPVGFAA